MPHTPAAINRIATSAWTATVTTNETAATAHWNRSLAWLQAGDYEGTAHLAEDALHNDHTPDYWRGPHCNALYALVYVNELKRAEYWTNRIYQNAEADDPQPGRFRHARPTDTIDDDPGEKRTDGQGHTRGEGNEIAAHSRPEDVAQAQCESFHSSYHAI